MKPIVPILGVISALWLLLGSMWLSRTICGTGDAAMFSVTDDGLNATSADMFTFGMSSDKVTYTKSTQSAFQNIATYLLDHPEKQLQLTGLYNDSETNNTDYNDLGVARAETIKSVLMKMGVDNDQVNTQSAASDNLYFDKSQKMLGGVNFLFQTESTDGTGEPAISMDSEVNNDVDDGIYILNITDQDAKLSTYPGWNEQYELLKQEIKDDRNKLVMVTCYNDDSALAITISKKIRRQLRNAGFTSGEVDREVKGVADSPSGQPGVQISLQTIE